MERALHTARLLASRVLSGRSQTFHLEFEVQPEREALGGERFGFAPGQFISVLAERTRPDGRVKLDTRAYSLASAPGANRATTEADLSKAASATDKDRFDLCLNRVPRTEAGGGFFSNLLCDLRVGDTIRFHGPHGDFVLREPLTDSILIAQDTGIAPMRAMLMALAAGEPQALAAGKQLWLLHGAAAEDDLYYAEFFRSLAERHRNFHYLPVCVSDSSPVPVAADAPAVAAYRAQADASKPPTQCAPDGRRKMLAEHLESVLQQCPSIAMAYICGLNEMVSPVRGALKSLGWDRKQIVFERYD